LLFSTILFFINKSFIVNIIEIDCEYLFNSKYLYITFHSVFYRFSVCPLLAERLDASASIIGLTGGGFSIFSIIAVFLSISLWGLVDRFGVKRMLLLGVIYNILNSAILIRVNAVLELIIAQMIAGLAFLLHEVASQASFSRLSELSQRKKRFGLISFVAAAGQGVGPI
jgi:MFS family permease